MYGNVWKYIDNQLYQNEAIIEYKILNYMYTKVLKIDEIYL